MKIQRSSQVVFLFFILVFISIHSECKPRKAKIRVEYGNLSFLKNEKNLNIMYDYDFIMVGKYREEEYVNKKVQEINEKGAGKGDKWKANWIGARKQRYEPKFEDLLGRYLLSIGMSASQLKSDAKYTMIVKTTSTDPGYNVRISKRPAYVNLEFIFVESSDLKKIITKLYCKNLPGSQAMDYDFDAGSRIAESYAKGGKMLGKYLRKKLD